MRDATIFWLNALVGDLTGLVAMGAITFVVAQAVLEWRATRRARRLGAGDADAIHARLDALGRQLDDFGRQLMLRGPVGPVRDGLADRPATGRSAAHYPDVAP